MKAFLILEDGTVFTGTSIGSTREIISEIVFNTSMTGYLEVLTDPSYAGQAVVMTYPLIGNYGITPDIESARPWPDGYIVRELSRMPSNFRCQGSIQDFLTKHDIPGIAGIDTRALTKILREKGTMNGMITTNENYNLDEILPKLKEYTTGNVVDKVTCSEKNVLKGRGKKVALMDFGAKNNIAKSLNARGCEVTIYPAHTSATSIRCFIPLERVGKPSWYIPPASRMRPLPIPAAETPSPSAPPPGTAPAVSTVGAIPSASPSIPIWPKRSVPRSFRARRIIPWRPSRVSAPMR